MIFLEKKSRFVLVHAWQSLTAGLLSMIFQVAFLWSTLLIKLYWLSYSAFICFMLVRVILDAPSQRIYKCESSISHSIISIDIMIMFHLLIDSFFITSRTIYTRLSYSDMYSAPHWQLVRSESLQSDTVSHGGGQSFLPSLMKEKTFTFFSLSCWSSIGHVLHHHMHVLDHRDWQMRRIV